MIHLIPNFASVFSSKVCIFCMLLMATSVALAENNCQRQLDSLKERWDVVKSTKDILEENGCRLDPATASSQAATLCSEVILAGAIPNDNGFKVVNNWRIIRGIKVPYPNTAVGFCAGDKAYFNSLSPAEVDDLKKEFKR